MVPSADIKVHLNRCLAKFPALWLLVILNLLAACQTTPPLPNSPQTALYGLKNWRAEGKIALQAGRDRETASFQWQHQHPHYSIYLFGPFGQGGTWLKHHKNGVSLESAKLGIKHAKTAEALMQQLLGWQVPVSNLQYWMRGLAAYSPTPQSIQLDTQGRVSELRQQDWLVNIKQYQTVDGFWLPTKMTAERGTLKITVAIKHWQLQASQPAP